ncbi:2',5'-phosphodiesterase 12 [Vanessa tameamea]|uniref:2',5'-phosphodiesterase 12 n=1 Tax=Vanessa tameamea TaxID=334116 RepID=A0A8B8HSB6_VANTA
MVKKCTVLFRSFKSLFSISKSNNMNQNKCYFRYIKDHGKVDISFIFSNKDNVRQFNLSRKSSETLDTLCTRIATNVQKIINKKTKNKGPNKEQEIEVKIYDNKKNPISKEATCSELFSYQEPILKISDNFYDIILNAPWVVNFNLPKSILMGFPVFPENFETHHTDIELSIFNWYRGKAYNEKGNDVSDIHIEWEFITNSYYYTPTKEDVGMKLKLACTPVNKNNIGPIVESVTKNTVEAGPGPCPFENRHVFTVNKLKEKSFRCVSYNILADLYCDSDFSRTVLHPYCPPYALHIDYRKQLIIKELKGYNADIICLQEVDLKVFNSSLKPFLGCEGLEGLFYKKGKAVAEGLACFYRKDRFKLIGEENIFLATALKTETCLKSIWDEIKDNAPLLERILDRSTVASASILQSIENLDEIILVGNTHLYFHPDADHIRLLQGGIIIYWLGDLQKKLRKQYPEKRISLILSGDFNSVPSCGIYQLYTTGSATSSLPDWKSNPNEAVTGLSLSQEISLDSACGTPQYTNYTEGFADCLDYIFYEKNNLKVEQVIPFPSIEELKTHTALPSIVFPSDHISIIADFQFK